VDCVWLLSRENYRALCKSTGRKRLREEFEGKLPPHGISPCLHDLPVAYLKTSLPPAIKGAALLVHLVGIGDSVGAATTNRVAIATVAPKTSTWRFMLST
jgi:hypothetical protein